MSAVLSMRRVTRTFGSGPAAVTAIREFNLDVEAGEFIAIMGASGSGKSTVLAIAGGLDTEISGDVIVSGTSLKGMGRDALARLRRRQLGYVFQDYNLVPTLSVLENVMLPLELDKVPLREAMPAARTALARVGIAELADRRLDQVSGGQRQRVAIARSIIGERTLILADEPTGALDSATGDDILALLRRLADEGVAVLVVTHDPRHAAWADRVIFLRDGHIVDESRALNDANHLLQGAK